MKQPLIIKREVLKDTSNFLSIANPVSIRAKLFVQILWQLNIDWDKYLDANLQEEWNAILTDLQQLSRLTKDQCFFQDFTKQDTQLHVLADASTKAYGTVAFLTSGVHATLEIRSLESLYTSEKLSWT